MTATLVRFKVTEAFRGTEQGEIELHLRGSSSASCDPPFEMGESWLVYGSNRWEGGPGWTTSSCSRTRLLSAAAEDLQYLRTPDGEKSRSHIAGSVAAWVHDPSPQKQGRTVGIPGVPVFLEGAGRRIETKTDSGGRYRVDVAGGRAYRVEFGAVAGWLIRGSGQVVDDNGLPVPFLPIALESTPRHLRQHAVTDAAGVFRFPLRYPGPYFVALSDELWQRPPELSLNTTPITVPLSTGVDAGKLRVPASVRLVLVELVIEDSEGNPAAGAEVHFKQPNLFNAISYDAMPTADERGRFLISLVAGERYEFMPSYDRKTSTGTVYEEGRAVIRARPGPVRIRLAPFR